MTVLYVLPRRYDLLNSVCLTEGPPVTGEQLEYDRPLADLVARQRRRLGLSHGQLVKRINGLAKAEGEHCGYSPQTIGEIERKGRIPHPVNLRWLATAIADEQIAVDDVLTAAEQQSLNKQQAMQAQAATADPGQGRGVGAFAQSTTQVIAQVRAALGYAGYGWVADAIAMGATVEFENVTAAADRRWVRVGERAVLMEQRDTLMLSAFCAAFGITPILREPDHAQTERLAAAVQRPRITDVQVVHHLRHVLAEQREIDDIVGPGYLLRSAASQLEMVERLLREAKPQVRELLLPLAGEWAQFAWWLSVDARDLAQASKFYTRATEWSHDGNDPQLGGFLLSCKSELAVVTGDFEEARRLAEAAQQHQWQPTPALQAWAVLRQAHAHALLGERDACEHQLARAEDLLTASNPEQEPPYIYWLGPEYLAGDRGMCYVELGLGKPAAEQIGNELQAMPSERQRDRGWCLIRQGEAFILAGEPEQAGTVAGEALTIASRTGSVRILEKARRLRDLLADRWRDLAVVGELDERLRDEV